ncbi:MAG: flavodoxin family protein [Promethearchaeota archaeon]|jgi:flavodoxin
MKTIIIYNTATGNTRAIANKMKEVLEKYNHECDIYRDKDIQNEIKSNPHFFDSYTLVCLGSCTHGFQPAITFKKFIYIIKDYDLKGKSLVCFSSSGGQQWWKETCNKIKNSFPEMNHVGNFGCSLRRYDSTIKNFEEFVETLD